jgi:hypothetical protein
MCSLTTKGTLQRRTRKQRSFGVLRCRFGAVPWIVISSLRRLCFRQSLQASELSCQCTAPSGGGQPGSMASYLHGEGSENKVTNTLFTGRGPTRNNLPTGNGFEYPRPWMDASSTLNTVHHLNLVPYHLPLTIPFFFRLEMMKPSSSTYCPSEAQAPAADPRLSVEHFLLQIQSVHVRTCDHKPVPLHFDSKINSLAPYIWYIPSP